MNHDALKACPTNRQAHVFLGPSGPFFHKGLQKLLCRLLTMEANRAMKWVATAVELYGDAVVFFGFAYPFARQLFHREPYPGR
jgi:hypothetical protein